MGYPITVALPAGVTEVVLPGPNRFVRVTPLKPAQLWVRGDGIAAAAWADGSHTTLDTDDADHLDIEVIRTPPALSIFATSAVSVYIDSFRQRRAMPGRPWYATVAAGAVATITLPPGWNDGGTVRVTGTEPTMGGIRVTGDGSTPTATNGYTNSDGAPLIIHVAKVGGTAAVKVWSETAQKIRVEPHLPL